MQIIRGLHNLQSAHLHAVLTIGNFDGVHKGHQAILASVCEAARKAEKPSMVMVFEPQPKEFFMKDNAPARLTPFREKFERLADTGIDYVLCIPFDKRLSALNAAAFVEQILIEKLHISSLIIGDDFKFGQDRQGNFEFLAGYAQKGEFTLTPTDSILSHQTSERVSSTLIREKLDAGELESVNALLGKPYSWSGRVIHGQKLGAQLGAATANVAFGQYQPPLKGVYAVKAKMPDGTLVSGVANAGKKPTVQGQDFLLEVHLFDWHIQIYGQRIKVIFEHFLRPEEKFASLEALKEQINKDIERAKQLASSPL